MLEMNPFVDVHVHPAPSSVPIDVTAIEVITVRAPVRGRGLLVREVTRADAELFAFFSSLVASGGEADLDSDATIVSALVELGFLVEESQIVSPPRYCVGTPAGSTPFALHAGVKWPSDYAEQPGRLSAFADGPVVWIGDPSELISPYWRSADGPSIEPAPFARFAAHHEAFARDEVVVIRDFVEAAERDALQRYYRELLAAGLVPLGDRQNRDRYSLYNDPIGRFVHTRYAAAFSAVAGQPLTPSFCYFFSYVPGASLAPHKDRAQAAFSISLQIDSVEPWPLDFVFDDGRTHSASLRVGDAVLYHGESITHSRAPATAASSVLVLEYVPASFTGLLI